MKDQQTYGKSKYRGHKKSYGRQSGPRPLKIRPLPQQPSSKLPLIKFAVFIALVAGGIYFVNHAPLPKQQSQEFLPMVENLAKEHASRWDEQYPGGYKLVVFEQGPVFTKAPSTLPKDFKLDWEKMTLKRMRADPLRDRPESLKLYVPLEGGSASGFQFPRQPGTQCVISRHDGGELVIELAADYGDRVVLLFGLR